MKNYAIVNYFEKTITLFFRWQTFTFDLTQGDVGDFWYGFDTHDGEVYDINFLKDEGFEGSVTIYGTYLDESGYHVIDTDNVFIIDIKGFIGDENNYLNEN